MHFIIANLSRHNAAGEQRPKLITIRLIPTKSRACSRAAISPSPTPIRPNGVPPATCSDAACISTDAVPNWSPIFTTPIPSTICPLSGRNYHANTTIRAWPNALRTWRFAKASRSIWPLLTSLDQILKRARMAH
jgi:hypothetical protein